MRDPRPRVARVLVQVDGVPVIVLQQARIQLGQDLRRDRLILLGHPMRAQLVVGEQHLRVERPRDVVDRVLQQDHALGGVR